MSKFFTFILCGLFGILLAQGDKKVKFQDTLKYVEASATAQDLTLVAVGDVAKDKSIDVKCTPATAITLSNAAAAVTAGNTFTLSGTFPATAVGECRLQAKSGAQAGDLIPDDAANSKVSFMLSTFAIAPATATTNVDATIVITMTGATAATADVVKFGSTTVTCTPAADKASTSCVGKFTTKGTQKINFNGYDLKTTVAVSDATPSSSSFLSCGFVVALLAFLF